MSRQLLALGDSFSCGEGVGIFLRREQTWVAQLAEMLQRDPVLLARPGARVADVRAVQLPAARRCPPAVASLLIGLNDVLRSGFDARAIREDMCEIVEQLGRDGHVVLLVRLHDPTALLPLPRTLKWRLASRVAAVNLAVDAAHGSGVHVLDLSRVDALRHREA
jgi:lysophospholipase L1-like esterase